MDFDLIENLSDEKIIQLYDSSIENNDYLADVHTSLKVTCPSGRVGFEVGTCGSADNIHCQVGYCSPNGFDFFHLSKFKVCGGYTSGITCVEGEISNPNNVLKVTCNDGKVGFTLGGCYFGFVCNVGYCSPTGFNFFVEAKSKICGNYSGIVCVEETY